MFVCVQVFTVGQLKHQYVVLQVERIETFRTKLFDYLQGNDTRGRRTAILGQRQKTSIVRSRSAPSSGKADRRTCWTLSRLAPKLKIASPLSYSRLLQTELFNRKCFAMTFFFSQDAEGQSVIVGVSAWGIHIFHNNRLINKFVW